MTETQMTIENKARLDAFEDAFRDFKDEVRRDISEIKGCMVNLTNHFSRRPPWSYLVIITVMSGMLSSLATYLITHI